MAWNDYLNLVQSGLLDNLPVSPDLPTLPRFYIATDTGDILAWNPTSLSWKRSNGFPTNILAAGATQGNATPIITRLVIVATTTVSTHGVLLPAASTGLQVEVVNKGPTFPTKVYPNTHGIINGGSSNAADTTNLAAFKTTVYTAVDTQHWVTDRGA